VTPPPPPFYTPTPNLLLLHLTLLRSPTAGGRECEIACRRRRASQRVATRRNATPRGAAALPHAERGTWRPFCLSPSHYLAHSFRLRSSNESILPRVYRAIRTRRDERARATDGRARQRQWRRRPAAAASNPARRHNQSRARFTRTDASSSRKRDERTKRPAHRLRASSWRRRRSAAAAAAATRTTNTATSLPDRRRLT